MHSNSFFWLYSDRHPSSRFPCHDTMKGSSKIPSILYYDRSGKVRAVGAEARPGRILEISLEEQWIKSEWYDTPFVLRVYLPNNAIRFKLHLLTSTGEKNISADIPPLPRNKTAVEVFADYLRYIYACAATFIQDNNLEGADLWKALKDDADIVLSLGSVLSKAKCVRQQSWQGSFQTLLEDTSASPSSRKARQVALRCA